MMNTIGQWPGSVNECDNIAIRIGGENSAKPGSSGNVKIDCRTKKIWIELHVSF